MSVHDKCYGIRNCWEHSVKTLAATDIEENQECKSWGGSIKEEIPVLPSRRLGIGD